MFVLPPFALLGVSCLDLWQLVKARNRLPATGGHLAA